MASVGPLLVRGPVEVGQDVGGPPGQGSAEGDDLGQSRWHAPADGLDQVPHQLAAAGPVGFTEAVTASSD